MFDFLNFLRKKYGEYSNNPVRQGTIVDELAVKPTGLLMSDFYNTLVEKQQQDNINNWASLTEEQMDYSGNKFFFPRQRGDKAFGVVRIWMDVPQDIIADENLKASSGDGLMFPVASPRIISRDSLNVSNDSYGKYYFDLPIIAEYEGDAYNKSANQIQSLTGNEFEYTFVTNLKDLVPGSAHETNEMYFNRLKYSLNDRSLMNKRSLYAGLRDRFPYVYSVYAAGAGDKYMRRDRIQAIDLSSPPKEAKFLGKITGDNIVRHIAYYQQYPTEPGSRGSLFAGPFSIYSDYTFPQTIEAVDLSNSEPAYHGYALYQEANNDMYRGLYYDDLRTFMDVQTQDLLNISNEIATLGKSLIPNNEWIAGSHGLRNGDYGINESSGIDKINLMYFEDNNIVFHGGSTKALTVGKNINKRTGIKVSGTFTIPGNIQTSLNSAAYIIVGGPRVYNSDGSEMIDSYSGVGFGFYIYSDLSMSNTNEQNARIFFCNSERYDAVYTFKDSSDESFGNMSSLSETGTRLKPGESYTFEYVLYDNLAMAVKITPVISDGALNDIFNYGAAWMLPATSLNVYQSIINSLSTDRYGTLLKVTVESPSDSTSDTWIIADLKAVDVAPHRPTALFMFNVDGLEEPLSISFRGSSSGAINNTLKSGYSAYIWNIEVPGRISGSTLLSSGSWQILPDISDPTGTKDTLSSLSTQELSGLDKYKVNTRFGNIIIVMVVASGTSRASLTVENDTVGDINALLSIDYIRVTDIQTDVYHGNNKCDVYVNTVKNTDNFKTVTTNITRNAISDAYFIIDSARGFDTPIVDIISIIDPETGNPLDASEYSIVRDYNEFINSVSDSIRLSAPNYTSLDITYSAYNNLTAIQNYFESSDYDKLFGNILIKHKFPVYLDFGVIYSGTKTADVIANIVRSYFDTNVTRVFDVRAIMKYLYDNNYVNYVQQPITVTYSTTNETGNTITGTFSDSHTIREVDFYRVRNLAVSKL